MDSSFLERYVSPSTFTSYEDFKANFKIKVPDNFNFGFDIVDDYARLQPDKKAIVWCNDKGDERIFTFAEVSRLSNKIANALKSMGIHKGDSVMLILGRRYEYWLTVVALHKMGAIAIPASHMLTGRDIAFRNNAADIKMIIAMDDEHVMNSVDESVEHSQTLQHRLVIHGARDGWHDLHMLMDAASDKFERPTGAEATKNDDILILYFTSGTTGMPKMVEHDHTYPIGQVLTAKYWQNVQDNGIHLSVADTGWAKTGWGKIYGQWIAGSAIFVYDYEHKFDAGHLLEVMTKHGVTTFCGPATVYRMMVKEDCSKYDFSSLKYLVVAGEPLYPEVFNKVYDYFGLKIMEGFGQTETTVAIANFPWMEPKPGSMGKPSPGYEVDLLDEDGRPCSVGEEGHIVFRTNIFSPVGLFKGYYRSKELTDAAWNDGVYYTGDIAWKDEDGYYWYVGRADDTIKSSGYKIGPFEVESALQEHPAVHECAITGIPDAIRGQIVKATIVLNPGYEGCDDLIKELQDHVKTVTAPYKYPRVIEFAEALPKTISGKISRRRIKDADVERLAAAVKA